MANASAKESDYLKSFIYRHRHEAGLDVESELIATIDSVRFTAQRGASPRLKDLIQKRLLVSGWSGEVELDPSSRITITSIRNSTGLCFQTGNMGRMYADLLKLQSTYARKTIAEGVLILPTTACAKLLGQNLANFNRAKREIQIFSSVISMPLLLIGIE
jgi:hypothetical protein